MGRAQQVHGPRHVAAVAEGVMAPGADMLMTRLAATACAEQSWSSTCDCQGEAGVMERGSALQDSR